MNLTLVASLSIIAVTIGLLIALSYVIMILSRIRKMLKPVDKMVNELGNEFQPLLKDMSGITGSLNSFFARFDRITGMVFGKADMIAQGTEKVSSYAQKFIKNPKVEIESIGAGVKKAVEILFRKKGE